MQTCGCLKSGNLAISFNTSFRAMDALLSASSMMQVTLEERLEACADPEDEDIVRGILNQIVSVLPAAVVSCKCDEVIKKAGLAHQDRSDVSERAIAIGACEEDLELLQPFGPVTTSVGQQPTVKISVEATPALGANALPVRRPWTT